MDSLPLEILHYIQSFLSVEDILHFNEACYGKYDISFPKRSVNLNKQFALYKFDLYDSYFSKINSSNIRTLKINGIYWIERSTWRRYLKGMVNLEVFHAIDTKLSINAQDLKFYQNFNHLTEFAISVTKPGDLENRFPKLRNLKCLILKLSIILDGPLIVIEKYSTCMLSEFLCEVSFIKEFWIIEGEQIFSCYIDYTPFPDLQRFVLIYYRPDIFFVTPREDFALTETSENKEVYVRGAPPTGLGRYVEGYSYRYSDENIQLLPPNKRSLLLNIDDTLEYEQLWDRIVNTIQSLGIISGRTWNQKLNEQMRNISKLTRLTELSITCHPLYDGEVLKTVFSTCKNLSHLRIRSSNTNQRVNYALFAGLKFATSLKHLQIIVWNINLVRLFESLNSIKPCVLQRLVVRCSSYESVHLAQIRTFLENNPQLIVMILIISNATKEMMKQVQALFFKFQGESKAKVFIACKHLDKWEKRLPAVHREMTVFLERTGTDIYEIKEELTPLY